MRKQEHARETQRCPPRVRRRVALGVAVMCICIVPVHADDLSPVKQVSVRNRPRPEYEPVGIHVGLLRISPSLAISESYDDNVFVQDHPRLSDEITTVRGEVSVSSSTRMPWSVFGNVTTRQYATHASEDRTDWTTGASLTQLIGRRGQATLSGEYGRAHLGRNDTSFPTAAADPPAFDTGTVQLDFIQPFAAGQFSLSAYLEADDFNDVKLISGGSLDQDFRDRNIWNIDARTDFAIGATTSLFLRLTHRQQDYGDSDDASGLNRDASDSAAYVGSAFLISNLMRADLGIGALRVDNDDPSQEDRTSLAVSGDIQFYVTQLLTATLDLRRSSGASDIQNSSSFIATTGKVALDYELRRNLILSLSFSKSQRDYSNLGDSDEITDYGFDALWLINRRGRLSIGISHDDQDWAASSPGRRFTQNIYAVTFNLML